MQPEVCFLESVFWHAWWLPIVASVLALTVLLLLMLRRQERTRVVNCRACRYPTPRDTCDRGVCPTCRRLSASLDELFPGEFAAIGPTTRLGCVSHDYPPGASFCITCGTPR